jgi:hypothetical protein
MLSCDKADGESKPSTIATREPRRVPGRSSSREAIESSRVLEQEPL